MTNWEQNEKIFDNIFHCTVDMRSILRSIPSLYPLWVKGQPSCQLCGCYVISQKACNKTVLENSKKSALSKSVAKIMFSRNTTELSKVLNMISCCVSLEVVECMANDIKVIILLWISHYNFLKWSRLNVANQMVMPISLDLRWARPFYWKNSVMARNPNRINANEHV